MGVAAPSSRRPAARLLEYCLVALIFGGSLLLTVGVPVSCLWVASRLSGGRSGIAALVFVATCPLALGAASFILAKLNRGYVRAVQGGERGRWMDRVTGGRAPRQPRPVLEVSLTVSIGLAVIALLVFWFFFDHSDASRLL